MPISSSRITTPITNVETRGRLRTSAAALIAAALVAAIPAISQPTGDDAASAAVRRAEAELRAEPNNATLHLLLAFRRHAVGDVAGAKAALRETLRRGDGFLPNTDEFLPGLRADAEYRGILSAFEARLPRTANAPVAHRFADRTLLPEGVAWDAASGRTFVGSARGVVVSVDPAGREAVFGEAARDPLLGLIVHRGLGWLCAVSSNAFVDDGQAEKRNQLNCLDLETGALKRRYQLPEAGGINDVQIDAEGHTAYLSDSDQGTIWRLSLDDGALDRLIPENSLRDVNGLALTADGRGIHAAWRYGIAYVDLKTGKLKKRIDAKLRDHVSIIDGLYRVGNDLAGIQSITTPGRVVRITLSRGGKRAVAVRTLQSHHHPDFDQPTTGAVMGNRLRVLATTQISRLNPDRTIREPETLKQPALIDVPLD
jgi:sugar lactone lactonase YvrE